MACITYRTNEATCYVIAIRDKQEEKEEEEMTAEDGRTALQALYEQKKEERQWGEAEGLGVEREREDQLRLRGCNL